MSSIPDSQKLYMEGKLLSKIPYNNLVPLKLKRIVNKACAFNPTDRYKSAMEMRNDLEKLQALYNWHKLSESEWEGIDIKGNKENITLLSKNSSNLVIIKHNNRKVNQKCLSFDNEQSAKDYINKYIKDNLIK